MKKKKKKKSRSSSLRRNEVSEKEQPDPSREKQYREKQYLLPDRARPQDYDFAKKAAQIPIGTEGYRRREKERTQERLAKYKGMAPKPYTRDKSRARSGRSVSRARPSASRTLSYSASVSPPPGPPGPPDAGERFKIDQAAHLAQLGDGRGGFHQKEKASRRSLSAAEWEKEYEDLTTGLPAMEEDDDLLEYEDLTKVGSGPQGFKQPGRERAGRKRDEKYRRERGKAQSRGPTLPEVTQRERSRLEESVSPGYEEYIQLMPALPEHTAVVPESRMMTKADIDRARQAKAQGYSLSGSIPGAVADIAVSGSTSLSVGDQARRNASREGSWMLADFNTGRSAARDKATAAARQRGMKSRSRGVEDIVPITQPPSKRSRSNARALAALMHTSDADLTTRRRDDLSIAAGAMRSFLSATGIRPGTPLHPEETEVPELITRDEGIAMSRDETGRLVLEKQREMVSKYGRPGIKIRDMTARELDDERDRFLADAHSRWAKKALEAQSVGVISPERARQHIDAGHPSYREPGRDRTREPLGTTGRRKYHAQMERQRAEKFWEDKGTPQQVQEKLGLGRFEKYHKRKIIDKPGTAKGDMDTYWDERKRRRLAREELAAQQPDEILGLGGAELPKTTRGRRDLSWGGTTTRADHLAHIQKMKRERLEEHAKPMMLGPGVKPVGRDKTRPSLSVGAGKTLTKERAFAEAERAKWATRAELKAIAEQAELPIREPGSAYPQHPARKKLVSRRKKKFSATLLYGDSLVVPGAEVPGRSGIESAAARKLEGAATGKRPHEGEETEAPTSPKRQKAPAVKSKDKEGMTYEDERKADLEQDERHRQSFEAGLKQGQARNKAYLDAVDAKLAPAMKQAGVRRPSTKQKAYGCKTYGKTR